MTNDIQFRPVKWGKMYEKDPDLTKLCYNEHIFPVPWPLRNRTLPIMIYNRLELRIYLMAQARKPFGYQSVV